VHIKELKKLLKAEGSESEGLIVVNIKMVYKGILRFLNIRYDLSTLVTEMYTDPMYIRYLNKFNPSV